MKFLKLSIIILFLLSLLSAAVTFYLSTIRENEKEKRIYLEGVKIELEGNVEALERERTGLKEKVTKLESQNQDLTQKFEAEKEAHKRTLGLIQEKDQSLESLRLEAGEAQKAFENAQKRNRELERILDELEARMRQVESQSTPPGPGAGYVDVSVAPAPSALAAGSRTDTPQVSGQTVVPTVSPVTPLPKPPKRRRFFPFLRSSEEKPEEPVQEGTREVRVEPPTTKEKTIPERPAPKPELPKIVEPPRKSDQRIAAGSVLLINRKYNFIVINLGSRQGLSLDEVLLVQKGGSDVAKVRIEKLYDDYCAAYIIEEQSENPIGEGDVVTAA
ncbi:MAG: hypothetical protein HY584_01820 [Candidatus Omnitrophica bacterium]|nr:hypothetical protein [Candidatus Omnitrophota bacterium]